jgi:hypothetical protein
VFEMRAAQQYRGSANRSEATRRATGQKHLSVSVLARSSTCSGTTAMASPTTRVTAPIGGSARLSSSLRSAGLHSNSTVQLDGQPAMLHVYPPPRLGRISASAEKRALAAKPHNRPDMYARPLNGPACLGPTG